MIIKNYFFILYYAPYNQKFPRSIPLDIPNKISCFKKFFKEKTGKSTSLKKSKNLVNKKNENSNFPFIN